MDVQSDLTVVVAVLALLLAAAAVLRMVGLLRAGANRPAISTTTEGERDHVSA